MQIFDIMKLRLSYFFIFLIAITAVSCFKKESPYPVPDKENFDTAVYEATVDMGNDYANQIYFSLTNGIIKTNEYSIWDIAFTNNGAAEIWMNNGKNILIYATDHTQFNAITSVAGLDNKQWMYDDNSGVSGKSGIGILTATHLNKVFIVKVSNDNYYKFILKSFNEEQYILSIAGLKETTGKDIVITKDEQYNFTYVNFATAGTVDVEPKKNEWDILFTRYRHIYKGYNDDGTDFLYLVTGVLSNPYNTMSAGDSVIFRNFQTFTMDSVSSMNLNANLDNIGFNWKKVDIQTGNYKVNEKMVYVIKDQNEIYWKLHFYSFVNNMGIKGNPYFRFTKL